MAFRTRAAALRSLADALEAARARIIGATTKETHLTADELAPEFVRMVETIRLFATTIEDGSWFGGGVTAGSDPAIGPPHSLRAVRIPLGTVLVFGASNFPLSYGVCGGDTASALAAGCRVIVKEHPAHPTTGRLLQGIAAKALASAGFDGWLRYVRDTNPGIHSVAKRLVNDPAVAAIGFTGSVPGGLAIERLARARRLPIPVFAEMGSLNPVVITPAAMRARGAEIAGALAVSIAMRVGQQCTRPGLIFAEEGDEADRFIEGFSEHLGRFKARRMVAPWIEKAFAARAEAVTKVRGVRVAKKPDAGRRSASPGLWRCSLAVLTRSKTLREEIFGPAAIVVTVPSGGVRLDEEAAKIMLGRLPGSLTCTLHAEKSELAGEAWRAFAPYVGRVILNGVPTGVRVHEAMVHSGPFPACNRPESTAVGQRASERWVREVCVQTSVG